MTPFQPIFATRQALKIAEMRQLLTAAGIAADPTVVHPEELEPIMSGAGNCLVIVDGESLPQLDTLARLRRLSPGSYVVIWTERLSTEMLLATMELGLHGLLSSRLPADEAALALRRICLGERLLRFDSTPESPDPGRQVAESPTFDAQWMLDGVADSKLRET
jgi:DNA-binding NarL/FixJ family response regulator